MINKKINTEQVNGLLGFFFAGAVGLIAFLPFIVLPLYSIDDYFLYQLPDINTKTLGYNFYSVGRFLQGPLADLLSALNLQPLTRPFGPLLLLGSLLTLGVFITKWMELDSQFDKFILVCLIVTNPFNAELLHYSIIPFYGSVAIFFITAGLYFTKEHADNGGFLKLIFAIIFYLASLCIYQIFYPMAAMGLLLVFLLKDRTSFSSKKMMISAVIPLISAFLIYTLSLKVAFLLSPPPIPYNGTDLGKIIKGIISLDYWILLLKNIYTYTYSNNAYSSLIVNSATLAASVSLTLLIAIRNGRGALTVALKLIAIIAFGVLLSLGFSVLRPLQGEISGRTFMAHGLFQCALVFAPILLNDLIAPPRLLRKMVAGIALLIIVANTARYGKIAQNQYRLNEMDKFTANRIVAKIEATPNFRPDHRVYITGHPSVGSLLSSGIGDYNVSALQLFSRVNVLNEVSGYNFNHPNLCDNEYFKIISSRMTSWPADGSIEFHDGAYFIKLNN